jgi:hypothetical protein
MVCYLFFFVNSSYEVDECRKKSSNYTDLLTNVLIAGENTGRVGTTFGPIVWVPEE